MSDGEMLAYQALAMIGAAICMVVAGMLGRRRLEADGRGDEPPEGFIARLGVAGWRIVDLVRWVLRPLGRLLRPDAPQSPPTAHHAPRATAAGLASGYPDLASDPRITPHGLAAAAWLDMLTHQPDRWPHVWIVGPTGAGKTTIARGIVAHRTGRVAILTPKPDDPWGGAPVHTIDDDGRFAGLARTVDALRTLVTARIAATKRGEAPGDTLTIVCDDWPVLASEVAGASDLLRLVARLGRSFRVRLVILSQSSRVKAIGLEGEGDTLDNFVTIRVDRSHRARLTFDSGSDVPIDVRPLGALGGLRIDPARWWHPSPAPGGIPGAGGLLGATGTGDSRSTGVAPAAGIPQPDAPILASDDLSPEAIRTLLAAGWSKNKITAEMRKGSKQDRLARIAAAAGAGGALASE